MACLYSRLASFSSFLQGLLELNGKAVLKFFAQFFKLRFGLHRLPKSCCFQQFLLVLRGLFPQQLGCFPFFLKVAFAFPFSFSVACFANLESPGGGAGVGEQPTPSSRLCTSLGIASQTWANAVPDCSSSCPTAWFQPPLRFSGGHQLWLCALLHFLYLTHCFCSQVKVFWDHACPQKLHVGRFTILSRYTQDSGHLVQVTNDLPQLSMAPTHTNCGFTVPCPAPPGGFDTLSRGPTYLTDPTQIPGLEQKTLSQNGYGLEPFSRPFFRSGLCGLRPGKV